MPQANTSATPATIAATIVNELKRRMAQGESGYLGWPWMHEIAAEHLGVVIPVGWEKEIWDTVSAELFPYQLMIENHFTTSHIQEAIKYSPVKGLVYVQLVNYMRPGFIASASFTNKTDQVVFRLALPDPG